MQMAAVKPIFLPASMTPPLPPSNAPPPQPQRRPSRRTGETAEAELSPAARQRPRWQPRPLWQPAALSSADVTPSSSPTAAAPAAVTVAPAAALPLNGSHSGSAGGGGGWAVSGGTAAAAMAAQALPQSVSNVGSAGAIFARPYRCPASDFGRYSSVGKPSLLEECKYQRICAKVPSGTP